MIVREVFMLILFFSATKLMNAPLFYISQLLGYRIFRWLWFFTFSWLFNFTNFWWYKVTYYTGFNPRPHARGDAARMKYLQSIVKFQSTPPREGRLKVENVVKLVPSFNPRPHARGDNISISNGRDISSFNPRPTRGATSNWHVLPYV